MKLEKGSIVTLDVQRNMSNTFIVDTIEDSTLLLTHPLAQGILVRVEKSKVNLVHASLKDSTERCIDYANSRKEYLDYNSILDLESLGLSFALKRRLSARQKQGLATICGLIAAAKFSDNLRDAMYFIVKNSSMLDEFNMMWFNNFRGLFLGEQRVSSQKQRIAIFNIAGYILAELENPMTTDKK